MRYKILIISSYFLILFGKSASAQFESILPQNRYKSSAIWDLSYERGFLINNKTESGEPFSDNTGFNGFKFQLGFRNNNLSAVYNQLYRLPVYGIGWSSSFFQNSAIGNPNALYFYFSIPFVFEESKLFSFAYNGAFGMSYYNNMYDQITDGSALLLGAYGNSYLQAGLSADFHFSPFWVLYSSVGIKYFANGSETQPESGLAMFPISVGVKYKPTGFFTDKRDKKLQTFIKFNQINIVLSAGSKNYSPGEASFLKATMGFNWLHAFNYKLRAGLGADIFYSDKSGLRDTSGVSTFSNLVSYAAVGSAEWALTHKLCIPISLGYYVKKNEANGEETPYYERIGVKYRFSKHLFAGLFMKAHGIEPDYFEWSLGYTFHKDQNRY